MRLFDEKRRPDPEPPVALGMVQEQGEIDVQAAKSDAAGLARFTDLPPAQTGLRGGDRVARAAPGHGAVRDARQRRRARRDPGAGAHRRSRGRSRSAPAAAIVVQMREDTLQILEFLPLENSSDKMFDPGPGAIEIPLPDGFTSARRPQESDRKVEVRQNHGIAVHGPIVPAAIASSRAGDKTAGAGSGLRVRAPLPWRHARFRAAGAERHRPARR